MIYSLKAKKRVNIQSVAGTSTADGLSKLVELKEKNVITDAGFEAQKSRLLSQASRKARRINRLFARHTNLGVRPEDRKHTKG